MAYPYQEDLSPEELRRLGLLIQEPPPPLSDYGPGEAPGTSAYANLTPGTSPPPPTPEVLREGGVPQPNAYRQLGTMPWWTEQPSPTKPEETVRSRQDISVMERGGVRSINLNKPGVPVTDMANPPAETATWTPAQPGQPVSALARRMGSYPGAPAGTYSSLTGTFTPRAEEERRGTLMAEGEARKETQKQNLIADILSTARFPSMDRGARVGELLTVLKEIYPGSALAGQLGAGAPGVSVRYDKYGNPTGYTQAPPQPKPLPISTSPEAVFEEWSRPGGRFAGRTKDSLSGSELAGVNAEATNRLNQASEIRGGSFRLVPTWDIKEKRSVPMDLNAVKEANRREPGRFRLLGEPGAQYESKIDIVAPWNLHPLTKSDVRIPVDVASLNRLDGRVTPNEVAADQQSERPGMVLMDRNDWSDVIAPIRGVWKSYQEVSKDIQTQLGVTTPEAVITRLETAGAAALGSSKLAVDVQAQVSHAIRMLRAMGVKGNMASEQIEREIKGTTFTAGMRSDVAARVLHNTQSQIRNLLESFTNVSDFNMRRDVGGGVGGEQAVPRQGGTLPRPNLGEEVRRDRGTGKSWVRRNGQMIEVQP